MIQGFIFLLFLTFNFCLSFFGFTGFVSSFLFFLNCLFFLELSSFSQAFSAVRSFSWFYVSVLDFCNILRLLQISLRFSAVDRFCHVLCALFHGVSSFHICTTSFHYPWLMSLLLDIPVEKWKKESRNGPIELEFGARWGIVIVNPNRILVHFGCSLWLFKLQVFTFGSQNPMEN